MKKISVVLLAVLLSVLWGVLPTQAQEPIPLRVEAAVTGQLTSATPIVVYSFNVAESLRMGFIYDVQGDMDVTLVVLGSDQQTLLAGSSGPNDNGVIVTFPAAGTYYVGLKAESGTSASYRLMIDADPALPVNTFFTQSYLAAGTSNLCSENTPTNYFTPNADLNVCYSIALIEQPIDVVVQWWTPSGQILAEETQPLTPENNFAMVLTGLVYNGTAFETGWWQVHFVINGELHHIQWVPVLDQ
jgi:hypothetical protein